MCSPASYCWLKGGEQRSSRSPCWKTGGLASPLLCSWSSTAGCHSAGRPLWSPGTSPLLCLCSVSPAAAWTAAQQENVHISFSTPCGLEQLDDNDIVGQNISYRFIINHGRVTRLFSLCRPGVRILVVWLIIISLSKQKRFGMSLKLIFHCHWYISVKCL